MTLDSRSRFHQVVIFPLMHFLMMAVPVPPERFLHVLVLIYVCVFNFFFVSSGTWSEQFYKHREPFFLSRNYPFRTFLYIITPLARSSLDTAAYFFFSRDTHTSKVIPWIMFYHFPTR